MRWRLGSFVTDERGGVLILTAFALPLFIVAIGCALDYSRASVLKTRLQDASDAAVLLAAKQAPSLTDADLLSATTKAFKANVTDPTAKIDILKVTNGRRKVELTASAESKSTFMGVVGFASVPVKALSASVTADSAYEIALVIDNSGSMATSAGGKSKMQSAKDAANKLIDAMMGTQSASTKTKFSVVPFTLTVNVGSQYANASWMDTGGKSSIHWENIDRALDKKGSTRNPKSRFDMFSELGMSWAGCVEHRPGSFGVDDAARPRRAPTACSCRCSRRTSPAMPGRRITTTSTRARG